MKKLVWGVVASMFVVCGSAWAEEKKSDELALATFEQKLGYSMGMDVGKYFRGIGEEIDMDALLRGLQDGISGNDPLLSAEEIASVQKQFGEKMEAKQQEKLDKMKVENKKRGLEFLAENKKKEGVTTTESGLQLQLLEKGDGPKPKATDRVKVDYIGTLIDGTEFDNSIKRGEPAIFGVDQVIPGWKEALQLMEVGSKYKLVIPSELAYGEKGAPPVIEPNSVLVFEVSLLSIEE